MSTPIAFDHISTLYAELPGIANDLRDPKVTEVRTGGLVFLPERDEDGSLLSIVVALIVMEVNEL